VNEFLLIRLGSRYQDIVYWLVWSSVKHEVIASGTLTSAAQLAELRERAGLRPVIVLVPGCDVIFRELTLPGRLNAQTMQALPFMLEDDIASDVEQLHITILAQDGHKIQIAAVDQEQMQHWLSWLNDAGLTVQQLLPDVLALPLPAENSWSMLQLGSQWLIRQAQWQATIIDDSWLPVWMNSYERLPELQTYTPPPEALDAEWHIALCELPLQLFAENMPTPRVNMLQGMYRSIAPWKKHWAQWQLPVLIAGAFLLLSVVNQGVEYMQLRQQQQQLQQQITTTYRQMFPEEKKVINPKAQLKQHLDALQQAPMTDSFLNQLSSLAPLLHTTEGLALQQVQFDASKKEFRLNIIAKDFQTLDQFRSQTSSQFETATTNMQSQGGQVSGTLMVRSKS
jgi:general secretion pathway protein L